jgi:hypothetical protein
MVRKCFVWEKKDGQILFTDYVAVLERNNDIKKGDDILLIRQEHIVLSYAFC